MGMDEMVWAAVSAKEDIEYMARRDVAREMLLAFNDIGPTKPGDFSFEEITLHLVDAAEDILSHIDGNIENAGVLQNCLNSLAQAQSIVEAGKGLFSGWEQIQELDNPGDHGTMGPAN